MRAEVESASGQGTYLLVVPWDLTYPGGVNQVVINLYHEIERRGSLKPLILVLDWHSPDLREEISVGCRTVRLRVRQPATSRLTLRSLASYTLRLPTTIVKLRSLIVKHDVRVINAHYPTLAFLNFVILKQLRIFGGPLLVSFHGMDVHNANEMDGLTKTFWHWLVRGSNALIACSDSLVSEIRKLSPRADQTLVKVHNGINPRALLEEEMQNAVLSQPLPQRHYILNVATFEHKKGQDILIRAFARMAKDFPDLDLVIIGGRGPAWDTVSALVVGEDLKDRVTLFKDMPHGEVLLYVERAFIFAFPSRYEPLGIAMLEAGVFGVPVVASRVDGIPEVINSDEVGILVEADNVDALEAALRRLLTNDRLRIELAARLKQRVTSEFSWGKAWEQYAALLDGPRAPARGGSVRGSLEHQ